MELVRRQSPRFRLVLLMCKCALVLFLINLPTRSNAAGTFAVHVQAVDAGQYDSATRVSVPWGDYVVLIDGDSAVVTDYKNYERRRVAGIVSDLGFRESTVVDSTVNGNFVQSGSLHGKFKTGAIDGLTPEADFNSKTGTKDTTWLDLIWEQSVPGRVNCTVLNLKSRKLAKLQQADDSQPPFHDESMILPNSWFRQRVAIMCFTSGSAPAVMPVRSLAELDYELTAAPGVTDDREQHHLASLSRLDPSITEPYPTPTPRSAKKGQRSSAVQVASRADLVSPSPSPLSSPVALSLPSPIPTATAIPRMMAGADEVTIGRILSSSASEFIYVNIHPKSDANFDSSDFELTLADGSVVHGQGFSSVLLRAGDTRQMVIDFAKSQGQDFTTATLRWYYRTSP